MADAATLLHRQGGFLDAVENGREVVLDAAHHEAVEEGDGASSPRACDDAAGGEEGQIVHGLEKPARPE